MKLNNGAPLITWDALQGLEQLEIGLGETLLRDVRVRDFTKLTPQH
ncbi:MAG: hypothetical protein F7C35_07545 [Desulfurococcales archaeon]|nr:hypothetical protein [Desulfurococcales archaeon]